MFGMLFDFDSSGVEAAVLCVLTCSALIALIFSGFALSSRFLRPAPRRPLPARHPEELGVLALWRLDRALRADRSLQKVADARPPRLARDSVSRPIPTTNRIP